MSARGWALVAGALAMAMGLGACGGDPTGQGCDIRTLSLVAIPAVVVEPVDSASGTALEDAGGWAVTGTHADSLRAHVFSAEGKAVTLAAYGPAGRYSLVVRRAGYRDWAASGVRVRAGACGPETVVVRARMQPAGGVR